MTLKEGCGLSFVLNAGHSLALEHEWEKEGCCQWELLASHPWWGIGYSKKENFFDIMQENDDSRNSNQTLKHLDCACLYGRGGTGNKDV